MWCEITTMPELEQLNQRLDLIQKNQEMILLRLDELAQAVEGMNPDDWIDSVEVKEILRISTSTLYRRRKNKDLVPTLKGGSYLYYKRDIYARRNDFLK